LGQIANALFNDMVNDTCRFALVCLVSVRFLAYDAERVGVKRRLGNETVRKWNAEEASDTGGEA
jgi:hypothetical protein